MSDASYPTDLRYTAEHEWVKSTGEDTVRVGITAFAQEALGDVVYDALDATPELVNSDPYGDGWIFEVRVSDPATIDGLMDATAYEGQLS